MFCLADTLRTSRPEKSISNNAEIAQKRTGESQYMGVFATKSGSQTIKRLPLMKENQVSKGIQHFYVYGKRQESGLTATIPLTCTSAIGASILSFPDAQLGWLQQLTARWAWQWAARSPFVSILSSLRAHLLGSFNVMTSWLQHPLFPDMADNILVMIKKQKLTHGYREQTSGSQWGEGIGMKDNISIWD